MALDPNTQKQISIFIDSQFPRLYEEYGQPFIDFVTAYYKWMETEGPLYDSRRASEYQDIDTTVEKFIIYFKDKYLPNIQLETRSNVELLVKHSLDVYRSRGTIRSIDLLFRLVFGVGADVYYPFDDVFQPSSGEWIIPRYIEVSTQDDLDRFVGKEITGVKSGATAFVESWVRKKSGSKQIDILYISALAGNFVLDEIINTFKSPFDPTTCPTMIGSLTNIAITSGAFGFAVGDVLPLLGTKGYGGVGRVANVSQLSGTVTFDMPDGGYAYTANARVLISDSVLTLQSVIPGANVTNGTNFFSTFEVISQSMANINYQSANGGYFVNNDVISTYYGNGTVSGTGIVLAASNGVSTNGQVFVAVLSGNLQLSNTIYSTGNTKFASIPVSNGYTDASATGNVMSESFAATFNFNNITGTFLPNEIITSTSHNAKATLSNIVTAGAVASGTVSNRTGVWSPGSIVTGLQSGTTANLVSVGMDVGIINTTGSFIGDERVPVLTNRSGTTGILPSLNRGTGATFSISNTLIYPETVTLNTDYLLPYMNIQLNATYGFPAFPTANLATRIADSLTYTNFTIGRISAISSTTPGTDYTVAPMVRIYEPVTAPYAIPKDQILKIANTTASFAVGDVVTQSATSARGLIVSSNTTAIVAHKLSLFNHFVLTSNSTTSLASTATGAMADITQIDDLVNEDSQNLSETVLGFNARIVANTQAANGSLTNIQIMDSGWGYEPGETVTMSSNGITATGEAVLVNQGVGQGYYRTENGGLSDIKKLPDNDYYQVSAYDIRASVAFDKYRDMLKALLHVAGTRAFGTYIHRTEVAANVNIRHAVVHQT